MRGPATTLDGLVKQRYVVTLQGKEGAFSGVLTEISAKSLCFENCRTVPRTMNEPMEDIAGRMHVFIDRVLYLQEIDK